MTSAHARLLRLTEITQTAKKEKRYFSKDELELLLSDSVVLFTPECYALIAVLMEQIHALENERAFGPRR